MYIDIRHRGGKKFRHLFLVHPDLPVVGIQYHTRFAIVGVVDDDAVLRGDALCLVHSILFRLWRCLPVYILYLHISLLPVCILRYGIQGTNGLHVVFFGRREGALLVFLVLAFGVLLCRLKRDFSFTLQYRTVVGTYQVIQQINP